MSNYVMIHQPNHPNSYENGWMPKHRFVMSKHLGRPLRKWEVVHHKNRNRKDNRLRNLKLFVNDSEHMKAHRPGKLRCGICGKPYLAKGLCKWHYNKFNSITKCVECGKTITKSTRPRKAGQRCKACRDKRGFCRLCGKPQHARFLCRTHYKRWRARRIHRQHTILS